MSRDSSNIDRSSGRVDSERPQAKWGAVSATLLAIAALFGGQLLGVLLVALYAVYLKEVSFEAALTLTSTDIDLLFTSYFIAQIATLGTVWAFIARKGASWGDLGFRKFRPGQAIGLVLAALLAFFVVAGLVTVALESLAPGLDLTGEQDIGFLEAQTGFELILAFLALVVLAPIAEETVFRGVLMTSYMRRFGVLPAVLVTSIIFGLLHPPLSVMITIGVFAVFLAAIYVRTESIWPAILLHSVKNLVAYIGIFMLGVGL